LFSSSNQSCDRISRVRWGPELVSTQQHHPFIKMTHKGTCARLANWARRIRPGYDWRAPSVSLPRCKKSRSRLGEPQSGPFFKKTAASPLHVHDEQACGIWLTILRNFFASSCIGNYSRGEIHRTRSREERKSFLTTLRGGVLHKLLENVAIPCGIGFSLRRGDLSDGRIDEVAEVWTKRREVNPSVKKPSTPPREISTRQGV